MRPDDCKEADMCQRVEQLQTKAMLAAERLFIRAVDPIAYKSRKRP